MSSYTVRARNLAPDSDNKIHDDEVARRFGFGGALVPGVEVFAYATRPFAARWGADFLTRGEMDIRFRRPVYDGEDVTVTPDAGADGRFAFALAGPDGELRADGGAALAGEPPPQQAMDPAAWPEKPVVDPLPAADAESLAVGTRFGTVREPVTPDGHTAYLEGVGDDLALYRRFVHPGALLRMVNAVLFRNVALGPWIHTGSSLRFLAPAAVPTTLVGQGVVTDRWERNGRSWVRFDALVLAGERPVVHVQHTAIYDLGRPG
jgi:acyl dehydratase